MRQKVRPMPRVLSNASNLAISIMIAIGCAVAGAAIFNVGAAHGATPNSPAAEPPADRDAKPANVAQPDPAPTAADTAKPSDGIADPLEHPGEAIDDLRDAKRQGWALAVLMGFVMIARTLQRLPGSLGAWFRRGRRAMIVPIAIAGLAAAFDAAALGGTWTAMLLAAAGAVLALMYPGAPPAKEPPGLAGAKAVA